MDISYIKENYNCGINTCSGNLTYFDKHSNSFYDNIICIWYLGLSMNTVKVRRYDIDWLRVILFGLLIPFHVAIGVYWSTYGDEINIIESF